MSEPAQDAQQYREADALRDPYFPELGLGAVDEDLTQGLDF